MPAIELFRRTFHREPDGEFAAPGRVNLIGEHTDYTGGLVLPFAINAQARVAAGKNQDGVIRVVSAQRPGPIREIGLESLDPSKVSGEWSDYVYGALWAFGQSNDSLTGIDLVVDSSVPSGAGLSSSAAVECATVLAAAVLCGIELHPIELARIAQRAENEYVGVPCGPMDQTASAAARHGHALLFDTDSHTVEHLPFDPGAHGHQVLTIDTRVSHALGDGAYADRRAACEEAKKKLGLRSLRDLSVQDLPAALRILKDSKLQRRVRHVATENERVRVVVRALRNWQPALIGAQLTGSHRSLAEDYEVSCPELDLAVDAALGSGATGARMTGGGFGGTVLALVEEPAVQPVTEAVVMAFRLRGLTDPVIRSVWPADGAHVVNLQMTTIAGK